MFAFRKASKKEARTRSMDMSLMSAEVNSMMRPSTINVTFARANRFMVNPKIAMPVLGE